MKPKSYVRKGQEGISIVAFRYDRHYSLGYVRVTDYETVAKQVIRFLSDPNNADVISIRRTYITSEEEMKAMADKAKEILGASDSLDSQLA